MKNKPLIITLIVFLCILAGSLITFMVLAINKGTNFEFGSSNKVIFDESYETTFDTLKIEASSSDIIFEESPDNQTRVIVHGKKESDVNVSLENGVLLIDHSRYSDICIGLCFGSNNIIVKIPKEYAKKIDIKTSSGEVKLLDLNKADIKVKTSSGDVWAGNASNANITTSSGDVSLANADNVGIITSSGDVSLANANNVDIQTTSGDIKVNEINRFCNLKSTSGEIMIKKAYLKENSSISSTSGDVVISSSTGIYIETKTTSGDAIVKNSDRKSDIELSIKTTSGDIYAG